MIDVQLDDGRVIPAGMADLALRGTKLLVTELLPLGAHFRVFFRRPPINIEPVLEGKVLWYQPAESGRTALRCELSNLTLENLDLILDSGAFERREYPRLNANLPVELMLPGEENKRVGTLVDYSRGGFMVKMKPNRLLQPISLGQFLQLWLLGDLEETHQVYGIVRQVNLQPTVLSLGLEFERLADFSRIEAAVKQVLLFSSKPSST